MLTDINLSLFNLINTKLITSINILTLLFFLAKHLILIFPLISIFYWFYGSSKNLIYQRVFIFKTVLALIIGMVISYFIGIIFPQERPFISSKIGRYFFSHAPTASFPSNHATVSFVFSFGFLFWLRAWIGLLLFIPSLIISLARIFLGIHWPLDIVGAFLVAIIACGFSQIIWKIGANKLLTYIIKTYQILFNSLIKKGWIKK
ncbi:MAG: phosphatase PAP2 family protein [Arsenophonus sp. ET-YP4-MAG3]